MEEWAQLGSLFVAEVGDMDDVTLGLDDERPDAERADAMLDAPVTSGVDHTTR